MKPLKKASPIFVIILLIAAVYFNTFKNAFQFDDIISIKENEGIMSLSNLPQIAANFFSRPVLFTSLSIDYFFSGPSPTGYHLTNVMLHICVSLLIYFIALLLLKGDLSSSPLTPFSTSLIFALHPINTESVTYIISRSSILSTLFYLMSLLMFIKGTGDRRGTRDEGRGTILYFISILFFILALGSKEDAATLPIMVLFYYLIFVKGVNLKYILFFIAITSIYPIERYIKFGAVGTAEAIGVYTPYTYLLTEMKVTIFYYLKLLLFPIVLNVDPDIRPINSLLNFSTLISLLLIISFMVIIPLKLYKRYPLISFSLIWFFVTLMPASSIFPLWDAAAEHRVYLSAVGFSIFLAQIIGKIQIRNRYILPCLFILILMSFSLGAIKRNFVWKDRVSLWEDAVKKSPAKARPHAALGLAYNQEKGLIDEAIKQYRIALSIKPFYFDALNNMGVALAIKGDMEGAMQKYELALLIKPNSPELYNNIAIIYAKRGEMDKAIAGFKKALDIAPNYRQARKNLEIALNGRTDFEGSPSVDSYK